jgi:AcrR family transcriptional regulator
MAHAKRPRRSPDEARTLILEAAERVFADQLPDVVGLKDVAREAGVSHALVTHYFGTYAALVEATLERRFRRLRDELTPILAGLAAEGADTKTLLAAYRRALRDAAAHPASLRLSTWALLSGRAGATDFFPHRVKGLKLLGDAVATRSSASREDIDLVLVASFVLTAAWAAAPNAFLGALGREPTAENAALFQRRIDGWLEEMLRSAERKAKTRP